MCLICWTWETVIYFQDPRSFARNVTIKSCRRYNVLQNPYNLSCISGAVEATLGYNTWNLRRSLLFFCDSCRKFVPWSGFCRNPIVNAREMFQWTVTNWMFCSDIAWRIYYCCWAVNSTCRDCRATHLVRYVLFLQQKRKADSQTMLTMLPGRELVGWVFACCLLCA